jgi:hypothetical protein
MKKDIVAFGFFLIAVFLVLAGCTQPAPPVTLTPSPTATPAPTTIPVVTPETTPVPIGMGTPGPTQTLPPQYNVAFQVTANGNTANPIMYVSLQGGSGMNFIAQVDIILTEPDGSAQTQTMKPPFSMGQTVQFSCSPDKNRIEIWVTAPTVGKIKVYDKIISFQSINP